MFYLIIIGLIITILMKRNPLQAILHTQYRMSYLFIACILIQASLAILVKRDPHQLHPVLLLCTFGGMLFGLYQNAHINGVKWIFWGTFVNFLAILLHGGSMPVFAEALRIAGMSSMNVNGDSRHQLADHSVFWWLGDWIPVIMPFGISHIMSPGDFLVGIGLIVFLVQNSQRGVAEN